MEKSNSVLKRIMNIRRDEVPQALLMFLYFFLVITTFWILKPLKSGIFIEFYDQSGFNLLGWQLDAAQAELIAKVFNMVVALAAAAAFASLSRSFRRQQLTYIFSGFIVACYIGYTFVLDSPGDTTVWSFYFFGDFYNTVMLASFFAFLNDSVKPDAAKRLYGLIVLGGVAGGAFGTTFVLANIEAFSMATWLWICAAIAVMIVVIAGAAGRLFARQDELRPPPQQQQEAVSKGNAALEGARLVFGSRYLLSIVAIVGLYEMVSTIMDFQFKATIAHYLDGPAIGQHLTLVYTITNWVGLVIQLFLTSVVMTRLGVGAALLFLPVAALSGSVAFLAAPLLWFGSILNTTDNAFNYSINQSAREALYVPTTRREKYQAKAFIDMFIQRFAKAVAVGLSLAITTFFAGFESVRWLSLVTALILVAWIQIARFAGREFERLSVEGEFRESRPVSAPAAVEQSA